MTKFVENHEFYFDEVFDETFTNQLVFYVILPIVMIDYVFPF